MGLGNILHGSYIGGDHRCYNSGERELAIKQKNNKDPKQINMISSNYVRRISIRSRPTVEGEHTQYA